MTINRTMSAADWTILLVLSVIWGGSFFFIEIAIDSVAPLTLVWRADDSAGPVGSFVALSRNVAARLMRKGA